MAARECVDLTWAKCLWIQKVYVCGHYDVSSDKVCQVKCILPVNFINQSIIMKINKTQVAQSRHNCNAM